MARLKSHPIFTTTVALLLAVTVGAGALLYISLGKVSAASRLLKQKKQTLDSYAQRTPFPSAENVAAAEADLARSQELLATMQAALKGRGEFATRVQNAAVPAGPTESYFDIANFVEAMRASAEAAKIAVPAGYRFGFQSHASTGPEKDLIPQVHRQRLVAEYLLQTLFKAQPLEIVSLQRNRPVAPGAVAASAQNTAAPRSSGGSNNAASQDNDFFMIDPRITAAVPGFVDTTSFKLTFVGYSESLRGFLNQIATFELPLVVRSVEVDPIIEKNDSRRNTSASSSQNALSALFGTAPAAKTPAAEEATKPIVEQVRSKFTVTIEYITLVEKKAETQTNP